MTLDRLGAQGEDGRDLLVINMPKLERLVHSQVIVRQVYVN